MRYLTGLIKNAIFTEYTIKIAFFHQNGRIKKKKRRIQRRYINKRKGRRMSMKIILWMRVWAHLSRWRMELIKLSLHLPVRGKMKWEKDRKRKRKRERWVWMAAGRMGKQDGLSERPRGISSSTLSASHSSHWLLHRNPLSERAILYCTYGLYVVMCARAFC